MPIGGDIEVLAATERFRPKRLTKAIARFNLDGFLETKLFELPS